MVINKLFGNVTNKKIAILGFSFKANTNDTRESPAIFICKELLVEGALLSIHDPKVSLAQIITELGDIGEENRSNWSHQIDLDETYDDADAIIILTEWEQYRNINWDLVSSKMKSPSWVFDTRKIVNPKKIKNCDFNFWQVGLGNNI